MPHEVGGDYELGRVSYISDDRLTAHVELRQDGRYSTIKSTDPLQIQRGDVLFIDVDNNSFHAAPMDLWSDSPSIGIVRIKTAESTLIDNSGRLLSVPTRSHVDYQINNTVEYEPKGGVTHVWSQKPVRPLDYSDAETTSAERFRRTSSPGDKLDFDQFGGGAATIQRAKELVVLSLREQDRLAAIGARPVKGVLFTGLPGTGKTFLAKIIADQADAEFYEISGPQIFSKWYGESEQVLRAIFDDAARHTRSIIFFDEIDSVAGKRDDGSHEASRRVVAQLLTSMDGFSRTDGVIVIAATNRPDDIDVALRRPGRFDWEIEFPLPDLAARLEIIRVSGSRLKVRGTLPFAAIAEATDKWSAAELVSIWSEAALLAVAERRDEIASEDYLGGFQRAAELHLRRTKHEIEADEE